MKMKTGFFKDPQIRTRDDLISGILIKIVNKSLCFLPSLGGSISVLS